MPPVGRDRAQVVCVACHSRKVRCNLQESRDGVCRNCSRHNKRCVVRTGQRNGGLGKTTAPISPPRDLNRETGSTEELCTQRTYLGENTFLAHEAEALSTVPQGLVPALAPLHESVLRLTEATALPKPPLFKALTESYFEHVFHRYPVAEPEDIENSKSSLLKQAVCFAGSLMRHSANPGHLAVTQSFYEKTKLMILLNYSSNPIDTLAAMCLMICWSANPSDSLSLDGPWHWTGVAVRLALQMGLHKEATYINQPHGSRLRRMWWILMNADRLQAVCFGRPLAVRASDTNTQLPELSDFAEDNISSKVFVHYARLIEIVGRIASFEIHGRKASDSEREQIYCSLCEWIKNLPDSIRLFDTKGQRQPYRQSVVELHILFFTAIIILDAHRMRVENTWYMSTPSVIAASCGARLIEEVECHEDIASMSSPAVFYIMVISVPLLYRRVSSEEKEEIRRAEVQILYSSLEQLGARYGSATLARRYLDKISEEGRRSRSEVQVDLEAHQAAISGHDGNQSSWATGDLFPFPSTLCPNMELVDFDINDQSNAALEFFPVRNDPLHWAFNEPHSFLDFFQLDDMTETLSTAIPFESASTTFS